MTDNKSLFKGLGVGALTGACVGLGSFFLATIPKTQGMGLVLFWLTPFLAGFAIALVTRRPRTGQAAMWLALIASLVILVATGREGVLCAVLAFPVLAAGLAIGAVLGYLFRRHVLERISHQVTLTGLLLALMPVLILAGHRAEKRSLDKLRQETISNSVVVQAPLDEVWEHIQSIDRIGARKPWLMYIGLPVPVRCTLQRTGVGAKRTCYFENGFIEETITEWFPPHSMRLTIDRTNMPGRHWLGFQSADYELHQEGAATRVTRTTTITSRLYPIWYCGFSRGWA